MPGVKNRLQAFKKASMFCELFAIEGEKKKKERNKHKVRDNPVFEPAAERLDLPLINQTQQFKGRQKSVKNILSVATRWHRAVPLPHDQASCPHLPGAERFTLAISSPSLDLMGGKITPVEDTILKQVQVVGAVCAKRDVWSILQRPVGWCATT